MYKIIKIYVLGYEIITMNKIKFIFKIKINNNRQ